MKNVNTPIRIPQDLRDTVSALRIDPAKMVQYYIDRLRFYPYFCDLTEDGKSDMLFRISQAMVECQRSSDVASELDEINQRYSSKLIILSKDQTLSGSGQDLQSTALITDWQSEIYPLINFPQEVIIEGGGTVYPTFNFLLINSHFGQHTGKYLQMLMKSISMVQIYAHYYPDDQYSHKAVMRLFQQLWENEDGIFLPRSAAQTTVINEYGKRFGKLFIAAETLRNFSKRIQLFRPLIREWAAKMKEV